MHSIDRIYFFLEAMEQYNTLVYRTVLQQEQFQSLHTDIETWVDYNDEEEDEHTISNDELAQLLLTIESRWEMILQQSIERVGEAHWKSVYEPLLTIPYDWWGTGYARWIYVEETDIQENVTNGFRVQFLGKTDDDVTQLKQLVHEFWTEHKNDVSYITKEGSIYTGFSLTRRSNGSIYITIGIVDEPEHIIKKKLNDKIPIFPYFMTNTTLYLTPHQVDSLQAFLELLCKRPSYTSFKNETV